MTTDIESAKEVFRNAGLHCFTTLDVAGARLVRYCEELEAKLEAAEASRLAWRGIATEVARQVQEMRAGERVAGERRGASL